MNMVVELQHPTPGSLGVLQNIAAFSKLHCFADQSASIPVLSSALWTIHDTLACIAKVDDISMMDSMDIPNCAALLSKIKSLPTKIETPLADVLPEAKVSHLTESVVACRNGKISQCLLNRLSAWVQTTTACMEEVFRGIHGDAKVGDPNAGGAHPFCS